MNCAASCLLITINYCHDLLYDPAYCNIMQLDGQHHRMYSACLLLCHVHILCITYPNALCKSLTNMCQYNWWICMLCLLSLLSIITQIRVSMYVLLNYWYVAIHATCLHISRIVANIGVKPYGVSSQILCESLNVLYYVYTCVQCTHQMKSQGKWNNSFL